VQILDLAGQLFLRSCATSPPAPWSSSSRAPIADEQGKFAKGDRIGVLLDIDAGWLRIDRNGKRRGPGFREGVMTRGR
jgi:hypothetical protein